MSCLYLLQSRPKTHNGADPRAETDFCSDPGAKKIQAMHLAVDCQPLCGPHFRLSFGRSMLQRVRKQPGLPLKVNQQARKPPCLLPKTIHPLHHLVVAAIERNRLTLVVPMRRNMSQCSLLVGVFRLRSVKPGYLSQPKALRVKSSSSDPLFPPSRLLLTQLEATRPLSHLVLIRWRFLEL